MLSLYNIVLFLFSNLLVSVNPQLSEETDVNYLATINQNLQKVGCSPNGDLVWDYIIPFIEDQYLVSIVALKDSSMDLSQEIVSCGLQRYIPIEFFLRDRIQNSRKNKTQARTIYRPKNEAYLFASNSTLALKQRMYQISILAASSKIILILTGGSEEEAKEILRAGWKEFRVLHIILIHQFAPAYLQAFVNNPFVSDTRERGFIYTIILSNGVDERTNQENHRFMSDIMKRVLFNVQRYPLKICMFEYKGSAEISERNSNGKVTRYKLKDGEIMQAIIKTVNFAPVYSEPKDLYQFGYIYPNGTSVGSLRDIEQSTVDILGNTRAIQDYGQIESEFLFPIDEIAFNFLTPKMGYQIAVSFFGIFQIDTSLALVITYVFVVILWYFLQYFYVKTYKHRVKSGVIDIAFLIFGAMILVPQKDRKLRHERNVFCTVSIFSMLICYHYQGKMVELLTSSRKSLDIDTVEDLARSDLRIVTIPSFANVLKDVAESNEDVSYKILYGRQEIDADVKAIIERMKERKDLGFLQSAYTCRYYKTITYSLETGQDLLHVTSDGPPTRYSAHMVPMTSPYTSRFNDILRRLSESGLVEKWKRDETYQIQLSVLNKSRLFDSDLIYDNIYTMNELWFIFASWFVCCVFSMVVFVIELFCL